MAPRTTVDRAGMGQAASDIDAAAEVSRGLKTNLANQMAQLTAAGWHGNAAVAFQRVFTQFDGQFGRVLDALDGLHESMVGSRIAFESAEEEQALAVNALNDVLNG